jgi:hypothetical protein
MRSHLHIFLLSFIVIASTIAFVTAIANDVCAPAVVIGAVFWIPISVAFFWMLLAVRGKAISDHIPQMFLTVVGAGFIVYLLTLGCTDPSQAWWGMACSNNLKQIGIAMHKYCAEYHCFPPAYTVDKNGKREHSWRALISPFMEETRLYDFNEPWDGPKNKLLLQQQTSEWACPADADACRHQRRSNGLTSYVAVVGSKAAWKGSTPVKYADLKDGMSNTILVIEVANSDIGWTEPRDLRWENLHKMVATSAETIFAPKHYVPQGFLLNDSPGPGICVLQADGSVRSLPLWKSTPKMLEALFTVGSDGYNEDHIACINVDNPGVNWWNCAVLAIWIGSSYLLVRRVCPPKR